MNRYVKFAALSVALVAMAATSACGGKKKTRRGSSSDSDYGSSSSPYGGPSAGSASDSMTGAAGSAGDGSKPTRNVLYFEFDSSELNQEGQAIAEAWAQYLAANPGVRVRLEGHADERGTREYNVGLGERRANAVQQALSSRGVGQRQISVSSFGEERPVALGHDEAAWSQNRRVEIVQ
jgi:peptidoglycan-associated lipoprotein